MEDKFRKKLRGKLWLFVGKLQINRDTLDGLVLDYTAGRTHHTKEMSNNEMSMLVRYLENECRKRNLLKGYSKEEIRKNAKRRLLIRLSYQINPKETAVRDIERWCEDKGVGSEEKNIKRKFNDYSLSELIALEQKYIIKVVLPFKQKMTKI